ncbi:MAG: right-handed parallel beta-helix repeat-containing protein [Aphanocapsa sp. GSE-SYN-MK-11-07L]|nr:right-handed parallel beta-helix repeat-containing protein [Aphanocapsa sp. GSE-SYN-MK-11-07L]
MSTQKLKLETASSLPGLLDQSTNNSALNYNLSTPSSGSLAFSAPTFSINENGVAVAAVTVTRTGGSSGVVSATVSVADGTAKRMFGDYKSSPIVVAFADGDTSSKTITIPIVDDAKNEANETLNLSLGNLTGGATLGSQNTAKLTILDNDPLPTVSLSPTIVSRSEGDSGVTALTFTVNFSHLTSRTVKVPYTIDNGTAIAGSDYVDNDGVLTFTAGQTSKTITVLVNGDKTVENNETFTVNLGTPTNALLGTTRQSTATILNDDLSPLNLGKTVYVAANGSDSNLGTIDQPFKTIQAAVNRMADGVGGTIYVRGGTYENTSVWIGADRDGSANSPLVIKNYGDEKVYLKGNASKDIIAVGGQYVTIQGFDISNGKTGIIGIKAQNLNVLNNTVHDIYGHGIGIYGNTFGGTSNVLVDGNTVYNSALGNKARTSYGWASGITISNGKNATVTNNYVYNNYGEGITATLSDNVRAASNTLHDNFSVQMYLDNATHSVFENNLIYTTENSNFFNKINNQWWAAVGIEMNNERYSVSNLNDKNVINNNIVIGGRAGVSLLNMVQNTQIVNNTIYGASDRELLISRSTPTNVTIQNNIFQRTKSAGLAFITANTPGLQFSHNVWSGGTLGKAAKGSGDIYADPQFVNPGGLTAADYRLKSTSPAANAGLPLNTITKDYFGNARTDGTHDIGAAELVQTKTPASATRTMRMDTISGQVTAASSAPKQPAAVSDPLSGQVVSSGQQSYSSNGLGTFKPNDGSFYGKSESISQTVMSGSSVPTKLGELESQNSSPFYLGINSSTQPKTNFQLSDHPFGSENLWAVAAQNPAMVNA